MADKDEAIARLDAYRAKRIGQILIGDAEDEFDADPDLLVAVSEQDGKELLEHWQKERAVYGTTPIDPSGDRLRLYPGGVTIWSGYPGAGKTTLLRQLVCHCLARNSSVFLASLEEHPKNLLVMLAATAAGADLPSQHQMQWFIDAFGARLRLWGKIGIAQHRQILATIRKVATQGVRHAVIDSLMCLDVANDDYEAQRRFANLLAATARASNVHVHLVAHPRKLISAQQELDINDVAGARELGGIVDNVIFIRRGKPGIPSSVAGDASQMLVSVRKQRHGGELGDVAGWYHRNFRQFHVTQFPTGPIRYLPEDAYT